MNKKLIYAAVVGIALYLVVFLLHIVEGDLSLAQLLLMIVTPLIMGVVYGKIKNAAGLAFILSFVMFAILVTVLQNIPSDINVALTSIIMMVLPLALLSTALAAIGGLIGRKLIKK